MNDVFITYARQDRATAEMVAALLQSQGWTVWWDREIPAGRSFDEVIEEALDASRCVVVLWSTNSIRSDWVKTEAAEGKRRNVLVPALIDDVRVPLEFRRIQAANLVGWQGGLEHPEAERLVNAVRSGLVDQRSLSQPTSPGAGSAVPSSGGARRTWRLMVLPAVLVAAAIAAYFVIDMRSRPGPEEARGNPAALQWRGAWRHYSAGKDGRTVAGTIDLQMSDDGSAEGRFTNDVPEGPEGGVLNGKLSADGARIEGSWRNRFEESGRFDFRLVRGGRSFRGLYSLGDTSAPDNPANYWNGVRPDGHESKTVIPAGPKSQLATFLSELAPGNSLVIVGSFPTQEQAQEDVRRIKATHPELFLPEYGTELYGTWGEGVYKAKNGVWAVYIGGAYAPAAAARLRQLAIDELGMRGDIYLGNPFFE